MSDNQGALIERAIAWCRAGERSDAEYLDREFAHTLVRNPLLFVAFRAGQRDRQAKIEDLNLDLRAAEDECGTLREDNATLRQAVAELRERNRKQDEDIIDIRALIGKRDAEIAALEATIRDLTDTITTQGLKIREQAAEIERLREAVRMIAPTECVECEGSGSLGRAQGKEHIKIACDSCGGHEDALGRGYIENQDVVYAEWLARPEVRRALEEKP